MEMGDSGDGGGGGFGFGFLFDLGGGVGAVIGILLLVGVLVWKCNAHEQTEHERLSFCTEVCSQYHDVAVVQGSQCYCRDEQGIYDPSTVAHGGR